MCCCRDLEYPCEYHKNEILQYAKGVQSSCKYTADPWDIDIVYPTYSPGSSICYFMEMMLETIDKPPIAANYPFMKVRKLKRNSGYSTRILSRAKSWAADVPSSFESCSSETECCTRFKAWKLNFGPCLNNDYNALPKGFMIHYFFEFDVNAYWRYHFSDPFPNRPKA